MLCENAGEWYNIIVLLGHYFNYLKKNPCIHSVFWFPILYPISLTPLIWKNF